MCVCVCEYIHILFYSYLSTYLSVSQGNVLIYTILAHPLFLYIYTY